MPDKKEINSSSYHPLEKEDQFGGLVTWWVSSHNSHWNSESE